MLGLQFGRTKNKCCHYQSAWLVAKQNKFFSVDSRRNALLVLKNANNFLSAIPFQSVFLTWAWVLTSDTKLALQRTISLIISEPWPFRCSVPFIMTLSNIFWLLPSPFTNIFHYGKYIQSLIVNIRSSSHTLRVHLSMLLHSLSASARYLVPLVAASLPTRSWVIATSLPPSLSPFISMGCCLIWASFDISASPISQKDLLWHPFSLAANADISVGEVRSIL